MRQVLKAKILKFLKIFGLSFLTLLIVLLGIRASILVPKVWLKSIAGVQTFGAAVHISLHPELEDTFLVTDKVGKLSLVKEGSDTSKVILDISEKVQSDTTEEGMLSAVIDPANPSNLYVYYSLKKKPKNFS